MMSTFFSDDFQDYENVFVGPECNKSTRDVQFDFGTNFIENFDIETKLIENAMIPCSDFIEGISTPTTIGSSDIYSKKVLFQTRVCSPGESESSNIQSAPSQYEAVSNLELRDESEQSNYKKLDLDYLLKKRGKGNTNNSKLLINSYN